MADSRQALAGSVHASGYRLVIAVTGGGSEAISTLLTVPGASQSVLEAAVPYSSTALRDWIGSQPEQFCCPSAARAMAMRSFQRAAMLAGESVVAESLLGAGLTASLASTRPKRGAHRLHACTQTLSATREATLVLAKGRRTRAEEEVLAANCLLNLLAESVGVADAVELTIRDKDEYSTTVTLPRDGWADLLAGRIDRLSQGPAPEGQVIFPGSFHPRHAGHDRIAEVAQAKLGVRPQFELSIENVDKPPLDYRELDERSRGFVDETLWLTRAPTFVEKARLFPGATFVVGLDTVLRLADPCYYRDSPEECRRAIGEIAGRGCRFMVFGRLIDSWFVSLDKVTLPEPLSAICDGVSETEFRQDISSTQLRGTSHPADDPSCD